MRFLVLLLALTASAALAAPTINTQPVPRNVARGASTSLSVTATASAGALSYQWRKDGLAIPAAASASYSLPSVQPWQIGDYTVVVTDSSGSVTSNVAAVTLTSVTTGLWKGLVGYYPLSADANDRSVFARNGTVTAATTAADRFNQSAQAYAFNGTSSYVSAAATSLGWPAGNANRTVSIWFRATTHAGNLFSFGVNSASPGNQRFSVLLTNYNSAFQTSFIGSFNDYEFATGTHAGGGWKHCVLTLSGGVGKMFINGTRVANATDSFTKTLNTDGTQALLMGAVPGLGG
ncbi:MAG: hypothetical protein IPK22_07110 [Verrucomicrobiaceae bacterium]|nr:hypothetical protein [Verrucomicrobiaceae bacterium]